MELVDSEARTRKRPLVVALLAAVMLAQMAAVMVVTAVQQTPTIDEPVYVGTAVTYIEQGSLRYNPEHPPLGKLIMGAGLAFAHPHLDPSFNGNQSELGRHVLYESGNDPYELMFLARLPMIVLTLLFGLVVFAFARELTNAWGALVALALYAFSPDVIAHGSLATLDVPAIGFLLTAVWLTWRARTGRPWLWLSLAGVALGAALATRMSILPAVPVVMGLGVLAMKNRAGWWKSLAVGAGIGVITVATVWAVYLSVDPWLRFLTPTGLKEIDGLRGLLVDLMPFPKPFRDGMRVQFGFEDQVFSGFLFGEYYEGSRWYYLPSAVLVKTPLAMMLLWVAGAAAMLAVRRLRMAAVHVLVVPAVLFAVAMTGARDFGSRYAIFLPIFLAVAASAFVTVRGNWPKWSATALASLVAASSLSTFPYYLPYSNEAFGGTANTHNNLHDSNADWGQDLGRLADRLRERYPGEKVWLVYKGAGVPEAYGIVAENPLDEDPADVRGLLVVSDSSVAKAQGRLKVLLSDSGAPVDEVGHSISIYRR